MNIAIDISPLKSGNFLQHRVRGTGFYLENLKVSLLRYFPDNKYTFFTRDKKLSKDIDLAHYPYFEPFFITLPLFKKHKTVVTVHDLIPLVFLKEFPAGIRGKIKWQIQKYLLKNADAIITDSQSSKRDIIQYASILDTKVHVVYLAASENFQKLRINDLRLKSAREKYKLPGKFALYVGDVTWNKNLPRLIEAIKKTNIPLVMVGKALTSTDFDKKNPWNQDLLKVQRLIKNNKNIILPGFVESSNLVALYNLATFFIMPSLYEGFGLPILEAMSCGCPVITSREGSIPEVAGSAAFYVDAYDVTSIKKGINEVLSNIDLQKELSKKGILQAKKFSWKKTAAQTIAVYEEIIRKQ
ncbi:MAG: glycosyltransferase family 1 protein [Candidatus Pacearchaeota archaeon]